MNILSLIKKIGPVLGYIIFGAGIILFFGGIFVPMFSENANMLILGFIATPIGAVVALLGSLLLWISGVFKDKDSNKRVDQ